MTLVPYGMGQHRQRDWRSRAYRLYQRAKQYTPAGIRTRVEEELADRMGALRGENRMLRAQLADLETSRGATLQAMQRLRDETRRVYKDLSQERPYVIPQQRAAQSGPESSRVG